MRTRGKTFTRRLDMGTPKSKSLETISGVWISQSQEQITPRMEAVVRRGKKPTSSPQMGIFLYMMRR